MGSTEDDRDDPTLGERPPADRLALAVARARIANELFADDLRVEIGRYQLLERVGEGGMGVVWGAWDPKLERRVAIKLMSAKLGDARDRILEEGQALARLSHPNVIAIYDVGVVGDQLYLVMEWVRGTNLAALGRRAATVREIVARYREAGLGLRAAHEAGLVHRDFKPQNVMVGDDGRVHVVDFGIALPAAATATDAAGTPRYMPEEQRRGGPVSPATDQYAFCVALRDALAGRSGDGRPVPVPAWLDAITTRGTAAEPGARYPSMAALLDALARDPARLWRRRIAAAAAVAVVGAAFAIGRGRGDGVAPCTGSEAAIAGSWNADARDRLLAHVRGFGPYGVEEAARLDAELSSYRDRWALAHRGACRAHARGELTTPLYERGLACLTRARAAFDGVVAVTTRTPLDRLAQAIVAARALPAVDRCAFETATGPVDPEVDRVAADLSRAHVLALASDPEGLQVATAAASAADRLGQAPLIARAQIERGVALMSDAATVARSVEAFERAGAAALDGGDDIAFVEAFARELYVMSQIPGGAARATISAGELPLVRRIAQRTGVAGAFARALLYNNAGAERLAAGDAAGARAWFRLALDEPRTSNADVELWFRYGNLALVTEAPAERDRLFREERDHLDRVLGPHHAFTLEARLRTAQFVEDPRVAIGELRELCDAMARWHPDRADRVQQCNYELGWLADDAGDAATAGAAMQRASLGDAPTVAIAQAYVTAVAGKLEAAVAAGEVTAARLAADPEWWMRFSAVDADLLVAIARDRLHDPARAIAALRRALAVLDDPRFNHTATYTLRRLARVRASLARHLAPSPEAARLAAAALAWYRAAGGYDERTRELTPITAGSR